MRRSTTSSSCLLNPRVSDDGQHLSVTVMNTKQLPSYSTERFYMLSELRERSHSIVFLTDYDDETQTVDTVLMGSEADDGDSTSKATSFASISNILLYLVWYQDEPLEDFVTGPVQQATQQLKNLVEDSCKIYLVVDTIFENDKKEKKDPAPDTASNTEGTGDCNTEDDTAGDLEDGGQVGQQLARSILMLTSLRNDLEGITVGVSNHHRAAPGLEACMEACLFGGADRRINGFENKSTIALATPSSDELIGMQPDPDAVQGVMQSLTCVEWSGKGDLDSFCKRAHFAWCHLFKIQSTLSDDKVTCPGSVRRKQPEPRDNLWTDPLTLLLIAMVVLWLYLNVRTSPIGDLIHLGVNAIEKYLDEDEKPTTTMHGDQL